MDRRHAFMKDYAFYCDGTMLKVEVIVSVVEKPKDLSSFMSVARPRTPSRTHRDESKWMTPDSTSMQSL
jgi:hypothetical protein